MFDTGGGTAIADAFGKFELERSPATQISGTAPAALVLTDASRDVDRDAGIKAAVRATNDIDTIV